MARKLGVHKTSWPMRAPFRITGYVFETIDAVVVEISEGGHVGRGEGCGVYYLNDVADGMLDSIEALRSDIEGGLTREELQSALPAGGARNAVDCALWDLTAKQTGKSVWELTEIEPRPVQTVFTIGIEETPEKMAAKAAGARAFPVLKVKLDGEQPVERIAAIRAVRPDATLVIDANQGFSLDQLKEVAAPLGELGVAMIEQPLRRGEDEGLAGFDSPVPICADESCLHRGELPAALERYDMINIKLDKTGGLTEGLALAREARAAGKRVMVGNMVGTSLSMAPAFVVAQLCDFVDLDGPLNLKSDYAGGMSYDGGMVSAPSPGFWGGMS
ncbi:N-acetyl-D-Glu racemase DgcA [Amphiplicatus metriothermophilus]|uniref:Dipeptide epimerase n=1 Tax=Amphiplicatus metriothermophilus TaxID=1519374 RepID=A0A239PW73_9PROT|nr:N-acetyl-D-Glu racemase DgcA [Amphiplicatus metriothermophilus]MBB5518931.1 L-alanine-DL-glutamate epimerase-like enolase superfamily enzyme [Amphiplicatus metriothermophilus]SNT74495.1 L-alanine-DL-glutamate epimerase [Amphiplicatus metriothermophilus]